MSGVEKMIVKEGVENQGRKEWIETWAGVKFYPLAPRHCDVDLADIARALSMLCRYTGHVSRFYSVAEHSVLVSLEVERRANAAGLPWREVRDLARWGLLHDASEAYIADVSRPVKHLPAFSEYRLAEKRLQEVIAERFGLQPGEPPEVKEVDWEILGSEVAVLKPNCDLDAWGRTTSTGKMPAPSPFVTVLGWEPTSAEHEFLTRFRCLWGSHG